MNSLFSSFLSQESSTPKPAGSDYTTSSESKFESKRPMSKAERERSCGPALVLSFLHRQVNTRCARAGAAGERMNSITPAPIGA